MAVSSSSAGRYACEVSNWRLSNLELQKILYIGHMVFLGRSNGAPLVDEEFEAWDYGPVLPSIYHRLKMFGSDPVKDVFYDARPIEQAPEGSLIREAYSHLAGKKPGELVAITHAPEGAWSMHYRRGIRHIRIPNSDILKEYTLRMAAA